MTLSLSALLSAQAATPPVQPAEYKQRRVALAAAVGAAHPGEQVLVVLRGGSKGRSIARVRTRSARWVWAVRSVQREVLRPHGS